jgi:hypothetical protein
MTSARPALRGVELSSVWPLRRGICYATLLPGQWDAVLQAVYDLGWVLLELDSAERPVAAYRRLPADRNRERRFAQSGRS